MSLFATVDDCLAYVTRCQQQYPYLNDLLRPPQRAAWVRALTQHADRLDAYLLGELPPPDSPETEEPGDEIATEWPSTHSTGTPDEETKLNLLLISVVTGWGLATGHDDVHLMRYRHLLETLGLHLRTFPHLLDSRNFRGKITNPGGFAFLATLSELALAQYVAEQGWTVEFETKFQPADVPAPRDIDLTVRSPAGTVVHLEVYTPHQAMEAQGFFDVTQDNARFTNRMAHKLAEKFGQSDIPELTGRVLLAVNTSFLDLLRVQNLLPATAVHYQRLLPLPPQAVDGILVFESEFDGHAGCRLVSLLLS